MNRLMDIRKSAGISRQELSEFVKVDVRTIERHEAGSNLRLDVLQMYADIFQLSMEFIMGESTNLTGKFDEELSMINQEEFRERFKAYNQEIIDKEKLYYLIWEKHTGENVTLGAHTIWHSFSEDGVYEKRVPRLMSKPDINIFEMAYGKVMIINTVAEAFALLRFGGVALIERKLCEELYPEMFKQGFLVKLKEY